MNWPSTTGRGWSAWFESWHLDLVMCNFFFCIFLILQTCQRFSDKFRDHEGLKVELWSHVAFNTTGSITQQKCKTFARLFLRAALHFSTLIQFQLNTPLISSTRRGAGDEISKGRSEVNFWLSLRHTVRFGLKGDIWFFFFSEEAVVE